MKALTPIMFCAVILLGCTATEQTTDDLAPIAKTATVEPNLDIEGELWSVILRQLRHDGYQLDSMYNANRGGRDGTIRIGTVHPDYPLRDYFSVCGTVGKRLGTPTAILDGRPPDTLIVIKTAEQIDSLLNRGSYNVWQRDNSLVVVSYYSFNDETYLTIKRTMTQSDPKVTEKDSDADSK